MENLTHTTDGTTKNEDGIVENEGANHAEISASEPPETIDSSDEAKETPAAEEAEKTEEAPAAEEAKETPKPSYEELEAKLAASENEKAALKDKVAALTADKAALEQKVKDYAWEVDWRRNIIDYINNHTIDENLQRPFPD